MLNVLHKIEDHTFLMEPGMEANRAEFADETMRKLVERMYEWTIEGTSYNAVQDMLDSRKKHKVESKE